MMNTSNINPTNAMAIRPIQAITKTLFAVALFVAFGTPSHASEFITEASFNGRYAGALEGVGGNRPVMIAGVLTFHGDGTGSADTVWNLPGSDFTDRKVLPTTFEFNYEVDKNGFGILKAQTFADIHFVATRSRRLPGNSDIRLALELRAMTARFEIDGDNLLVGIGKRLPDRAVFNARSLNGLYGGLGIGVGGRVLSSIGYLKLNGDGSGTEFSLWNLPDLNHIHQRQLEFLGSTLSYSIQPNGIGVSTAQLADGTELENWFIVTETRYRRGRYIAEEILVIQNELDPLTGSLVSGSVRRVSN